MSEEATSGGTTTATTDPGAGTTGGGAQTGAGGGTQRGGRRPDDLPRLQEGDRDVPEGTRDEHNEEVSRWVTYLQQMLNFTYQQQVVMEDGHFDGQVATAVKHFREQTALPPGEFVDKDFWLKLGVQDMAAEWDRQNAGHSGGRPGGSGQQQGHGQQGHGQQEHGQQEHGQQGHGVHGTEGVDFAEVDWQVQAVPAFGTESCWAAALAMVLNYRGENLDVEAVCQRAGTTPQEFPGLQRAQSVGTDQGLQAVTCPGSTAGLAETLRNHGPLWTPVPGDEYRIIVLSGIVPNSGDPHVHVHDPSNGNDSWMSVDDLEAQYGIGAAFSGDVLASS